MTGKTFAAAGTCLLLVALLVVGYWSWLPDVSDLRSQNLMTTRYVRIYVNRIRRKGERPSVAMRWATLSEISPYLIRAVLIAEDDRFYRHHGVDWRQFKKAVRYNVRKRSLARGASTITQQVARNLFLGPSRRPRRKIKEILLARHLERELEKDRILELYLNIVEWGEGVFGAEAASRTYFGKSASDLTPEEAVELAAALPSPYRWNPAQPPDERTINVRRKYLDRMREEGLLGPKKTYSGVGPNSSKR
ncbi:MAG: monofunctional biosynthetic peptidoglycan transglycosylase [Elusimicrobiota bacterium]